jgi:ectoine hydroxylase-related dioxygenase (phytanoyl-CoA dioxygenase family)
MMSINLPWIESPFFEKELEKRSHLTDKQREQARFYHENGYLILGNALDEAQTQNALSDLDGKLDHHFSPVKPRALNLWKESKAIQTLAVHESILELLETLYDRKPIPFQTLNFKYGSKQKGHSDTIHFNSFPERYMCASWMALEDMDEENGTLFYYPGSHKLNVYGFTQLMSSFKTEDNLENSANYRKYYEPFIEELMEAHQLERKTLHVKKGDVLIWSANLIHGGLHVKDESRTRWSQVNHYFFENCLYYTPMLSNPLSGEWFLRKIENIKTGELSWGSYNGYSPKRKSVPGLKYLISNHASYNFQDFKFAFTRLYHKIFK